MTLSSTPAEHQNLDHRINEENGVYDCAATSCDWTKEVANMYIAGYLIQVSLGSCSSLDQCLDKATYLPQVSKVNNTFCNDAKLNSCEYNVDRACPRQSVTVKPFAD